MTPSKKRVLEHLQLKHYSASYIRQAVLSAGYLGKNPAQASLGEAARYPPHPINDKRASQPYADAAYSAIKVLLDGVLGREWDKSMLPHRRQAPSPPGSGRRQPSRPCCLRRRAAPQGLAMRRPLGNSFFSLKSDADVCSSRPQCLS